MAYHHCDWNETFILYLQNNTFAAICHHVVNKHDDNTELRISARLV